MKPSNIRTGGKRTDFLCANRKYNPYTRSRSPHADTSLRLGSSACRLDPIFSFPFLSYSAETAIKYSFDITRGRGYREELNLSREEGHITLPPYAPSQSYSHLHRCGPSAGSTSSLVYLGKIITPALSIRDRRSYPVVLNTSLTGGPFWVPNGAYKGRWRSERLVYPATSEFWESKVRLIIWLCDE